MKHSIVLIFFLSILFHPFSGFSQRSIQASPPGMSDKEWKQFADGWERKRLNLVLMTIDSQLIEGQLLTTSTKGISIWPSKEIYHPALDTGQVIYLKAEEIQSLKFSQHHTFWHGAAVGGATGGVIGGAYLISQSDGVYIPYVLGGGVGMVLGGLIGGTVSGVVYKGVRVRDEIEIHGKSYMLTPHYDRLSFLSFFSDSSNLTLAKDAGNAREQLVFISEQTNRGQKAFPRHNVHFTARMGVGYSPAQDQILSTFDNIGITPDFSGSSTIIPQQFEVSLNVVPKLRVGASTFPNIDTRMSYDRRGFGGEGRQFDTRIKGFGGFVEYIPKPVDPLLSNRSEFSVGLGVYNFTFHNFSFLDDGDNEKNHLTKFKDTEEKKFGLHFRAGYEYYINRYISVQIQGQAYLIRPQDIPEWELERSILPEPLVMPAFENLNFSSVNASLGLRLHIPTN